MSKCTFLQGLVFVDWTDVLSAPRQATISTRAAHILKEMKFPLNIVLFAVLATLCLPVNGDSEVHEMGKRAANNDGCELPEAQGGMGGICVNTTGLTTTNAWFDNLTDVCVGFPEVQCCFEGQNDLLCDNQRGTCFREGVEPCDFPSAADPSMCAGPTSRQCCVDPCVAHPPHGLNGKCLRLDQECNDLIREDLCFGDRRCCYSNGSITGDPHLTSFDGRHYNFQGVCWYTFVKVCSKVDYPSFDIIGLFEPRDLPGPEIKTRTVTVVITIGGEIITLNRDNTVLQQYVIGKGQRSRGNNCKAL
ncbi:uncharacterized protein LOC144444363 [Glandiceps talaboti]